PRPSDVPAAVRPAAAPRPSGGQAAVQPAATPGPSDVLAGVSMEEPRIAPFDAQIRKTPFRIGRSSDNDGVIPVEPTSGVSGHHCVLTLTDGRWYVQDDQSKFGTTVNGQGIPKGQPFNLEDGAVIGLGPRLRIRFRIVSRLAQGTPS
ncbi:MAG: FHA domain-containing protein, partial [Anaerolineales bacterium]